MDKDTYKILAIVAGTAFSLALIAKFFENRAQTGRRSKPFEWTDADGVTRSLGGGKVT